MPDPAPQMPAKPIHHRRLWRWFTVGFIVAFVGMLIFYPMSFYNGRGVYETVLWRYYVSQIKQQMQSSSALGPTADGLTALGTVAAEHLAAAAVVGIFVAIIGRFSQARRAT
jgi:mannose/fructose/N-acetylgalactosamine-specific phosphotransferase system component IIC